MPSKFDPKIVCAYLYPITKYGYPPPAKNTVRYLEEMSSLGFQSVELEGIREEHIKEMHAQSALIRKKLEELHLTLPVYCTVLPELSSADKKIKKNQLELFEIGCQTAKILGAEYILDNGPLPPYQFEKSVPVTRHYEHDLLSIASIHPTFQWTLFWDNLVQTFREVCDIAAAYDLAYLVHPAFGVLAATPEAYLLFASSVDKKNLGYNFDTSNLIALKCNLSLAIKQLENHIRYVHISDNRGIKNEHLRPGTGIINWTQFFEDLKNINFSGPIGIDIGGEESEVGDLDEAYQKAATFVEKHLNTGFNSRN